MTKTLIGVALDAAALYLLKGRHKPAGLAVLAASLVLTP